MKKLLRRRSFVTYSKGWSIINVIFFTYLNFIISILSCFEESKLFIELFD